MSAATTATTARATPEVATAPHLRRTAGAPEAAEPPRSAARRLGRRPFATCHQDWTVLATISAAKGRSAITYMLGRYPGLKTTATWIKNASAIARVLRRASALGENRSAAPRSQGSS